ncbi:hypothetical protein FB451DRAFT_1420278 [Mycena latifolia]|nr:hypothetical protein FB451DRAFT_1420278 [Mycena latifolia]
MPTVIAVPFSVGCRCPWKVSLSPACRTVRSCAPSFPAASCRIFGVEYLVLSWLQPGLGSFSTVIQCDVGPDVTTDVVLGLDWAALVREHLGYQGFLLDSSFNAWGFFSSEPAATSGFPMPSGSSAQPGSATSLLPPNSVSNAELSGRSAREFLCFISDHR